MILVPYETDVSSVIQVTTFDPAVVADSECSLIEAIENANDDALTHADCAVGSGADVIALQTGTYSLTEVHNNINGLPMVTTDITIQGDGAIIERAAGLTGFPHFSGERHRITRAAKSHFAGWCASGWEQQGRRNICAWTTEYCQQYH